MRNLVTTIFLAIVAVGGLTGCDGGDDEMAPQIQEETSAVVTGDESVTEPAEPGCAPPIVPARCGPRNCVARCVTCLYDFCRQSGGSCLQCKARMEVCKRRCTMQP